MQGAKLNPSLISALVERWRPETHTFYIPSGEATITLQDVAYQLGLPVKGHAITGTGEDNWFLLGRELLELTRLIWRAVQFVRAHILRIIGGILMPDKSRGVLRCRTLDWPIVSGIFNYSSTKMISSCGHHIMIHKLAYVFHHNFFRGARLDVQCAIDKLGDGRVASYGSSYAPVSLCSAHSATTGKFGLLAPPYSTRENKCQLGDTSFYVDNAMGG
ncbi:hypothetical protein GQ457_03G000090 [Hibiscus cannabinus]